MYPLARFVKTQLSQNNQTEGEPIELKIQRVMANGASIDDGAPLIYTEKADGVMPGFNIRHDKWETAADAADKITKAKILRGENVPKEPKVIDMTSSQSLQGTDEKPQ